MPQFDAFSFQVDPWLIILAVIIMVIFTIITVVWGVKAHKYRISAGREELIGRAVEVREELNPKGTVFVDGERWTAISETGRVESGEEVIINKVDNLKLYVTKK